ncbi:MAG TPA: 7TM diverse intracellular signaling domain-containing protein [Spirochaetota bacterium]|nr:7TM diverse intracellular signaling domain-containing protein [Spirochaetota bacterium]HPV42737.1 7TM diverse intracellular signaling domain-containing protein [Spirochaetota bacterium]
MKLSALILFLFLAANASAGTVVVDRGFRNISLGPHIEYLRDPACILNIDDIRGGSQLDRSGQPLRWLKSRKDSLGFGFSTAAYWVRFRVRNNSNGAIECYLNQNYALISHIDCYVDDGIALTHMMTGHSYRFAQRPMNYRTFVFPITVKPRGDVTCYLRFRTDSALIVDLDLYSPGVFNFMHDQESAFLWMFYGILLVMLLYHLILFFSMRDIGYLYYMMSIAAMLFLAMGLNGISYQHLWPENPWWERYNNPVMIGLTYAFFLQFGRYYIDLKKQMPRADIAVRILIVLGLAAGLSTLIIQNYRFSIVTTTAITLISMVYSLYLLVILTFIKKSRTARSFLIAVGILILGVILYILKTYGLIPENLVTSYSMQAGWVAMVILLSLGLADRMNMMRHQVEETQKKYIHIIDSSNDIIFNLDGQLHFAAVNRAIKKLLGYEPEEVLSTAFLDYIDRRAEKDGEMFRQIYREYLSGLGKDKTTITFRSDFKAKYGSEPVTLSVKLDYVESEGKANIFGTASPVTDDILLDLMETERQVYYTDNNFSHAELLTQRLIRNLGKHLDQGSVLSVKTGLLEIIINSIEHGNLDIQFNEKSGTGAGHEYLQFVRERRKDSLYSEKRVKIEYSLTPAMVAYRITDEGKGFDHRSYMAMTADNVNRDLLTHGRGLIIARKSFDVMTFNEKGNQVTLIKYFQGHAGEEPIF